VVVDGIGNATFALDDELKSIDEEHLNQRTHRNDGQLLVASGECGDVKAFCLNPVRRIDELEGTNTECRQDHVVQRHVDHDKGATRLSVDRAEPRAPTTIRSNGDHLESPPVRDRGCR
jgi:hypothetical protein